MTDRGLDEMEERHQRTTPGPWVSYVEGRDHESGDSAIRTTGPDLYIHGGTVADRDLIPSSRQDLPGLIAEVRRLRTEPRRP